MLNLIETRGSSHIGKVTHKYIFQLRFVSKIIAQSLMQNIYSSKNVTPSPRLKIW